METDNNYMCVSKFKIVDTIGYNIQDSNGNVRMFSPKELMQLISSGQMKVGNMCLTKDNKLKLFRRKTRLSYNPNSEIIHDGHIKEIRDRINAHMDLGFKHNVNLETLKLKSDMLNNEFIVLAEHLCFITVGNKGLICTDLPILELSYDCNNMFMYTELNSLSFDNCDTSNVTMIYNMFSRSKIRYLDLTNFSLENVRVVCDMFSGASIEKIKIGDYVTTDIDELYQIILSRIQGCLW